jgi:hypothetical protein
MRASWPGTVLPVAARAHIHIYSSTPLRRFTKSGTPSRRFTQGNARFTSPDIDLF